MNKYNTKLTDKEQQFINEVKKKRPSLKGLIPIVRKYGFEFKGSRFKTIFLQNNISKMLKKDKTMRRINKNATTRLNNAYKELATI
jgi:inhibitor of KinA sporulation pathway (predicted exonuclease)